MWRFFRSSVKRHEASNNENPWIQNEINSNPDKICHVRNRQALMNESMNEISFSLAFSMMNIILFIQTAFMCFETTQL